MLLLVLSCTTPSAPLPSTPIPTTPDLTGWEGFFPLSDVDDAWLQARGLPLTAAAIDPVRQRVGKLVLHDGAREAPEERLAALWTATCVDDVVAAWNEDRCGAL